MRRCAVFIFAVFQLYWLGVFIPSHVRGAITFEGVRGGAAAAVAGGGCCSGGHEAVPVKPTERDRAHCVVCYFVMGLATPLPVWVVPELSRSPVFEALLLTEGVWVAPEEVPYDATGPPWSCGNA